MSEEHYDPVPDYPRGKDAGGGGGISETAVALCDTVEARCRCERPAAHDGAHECGCGGSWEWVDGRFVVRALPGTAWWRR